MEDTNDFMDDSVIDVSSTFIDVIDLTKESPSSVRPSRLQRNVRSVSSSDNVARNSDPRIPPTVLGNIQEDTQRKKTRKEGRVSLATDSNEVLILDNTIEEDKICYTVQSDIKEPVPLTCPICLEAISSKLKPYTTRCGHLFCSECLLTYLQTSKKCPTCNTTIALKSCTRLYL